MMNNYTKASEEKVKLVAATMANLAVALVATAVLTPIVTIAISPTLNSSVQATLTIVAFCGLIGAGFLCFYAWKQLEILDEVSTEGDQND